MHDTPAPPTATEAELLLAVRAGDRQALETLLARHQAQIYRFGLKMCRDPDDAQDVLQETLLQAARGVREFRGASSLSTWLYAIARNFCIKKRRRSKFAHERERSLDTDLVAKAGELAADSRSNPEEALASRQVERVLERAIDALDPKYREVLILRDVEGLAAAEVAEVLGLRVAAVKSRLHRARLQIRAEVAPLLGLSTEPLPVAREGGCPDVLLLFSQHLEDEMSADVCADMERHLQACARCQGVCDTLRRTLALCRTISTPEVPASVQRAVRVAVRDFLAERS